MELPPRLGLEPEQQPSLLSGSLMLPRCRSATYQITQRHACLLLLIFVVIDRGVLLIVSELGAAQFLKSTLGPTPAPKSLARERALGLRKFYVKNSSDKKAIKEWYDPTCRVAPLAIRPLAGSVTEYGSSGT